MRLHSLAEKLGVNYFLDLHPALGGGFGPGYKVAGGHDFVGDQYDGFSPAHPDEDPMDCAGHVRSLSSGS